MRWSKPSFTDYLSAVNDSSAKIKNYFSNITFVFSHHNVWKRLLVKKLNYFLFTIRMPILMRKQIIPLQMKNYKKWSNSLKRVRFFRQKVMKNGWVGKPKLIGSRFELLNTAQLIRVDKFLLLFFQLCFPF